MDILGGPLFCLSQMPTFKSRFCFPPFAPVAGTAGCFTNNYFPLSATFLLSEPAFHFRG